jgi:hypothetical protein
MTSISTNPQPAPGMSLPSRSAPTAADAKLARPAWSPHNMVEQPFLMVIRRLDGRRYHRAPIACVTYVARILSSKYK